MQATSSLLVTTLGFPNAPPGAAPSVLYAQTPSTALGTVGAAGQFAFTLAVTGALAAGSVVLVSPTTTLASCLSCYGYVSANGTVTIVVTNGSAAGIAGGSVTFNVVVLQ